MKAATTSWRYLLCVIMASAVAICAGSSSCWFCSSAAAMASATTANATTTIADATMTVAAADHRALLAERGGLQKGFAPFPYIKKPAQKYGVYAVFRLMSVRYSLSFSARAVQTFSSAQAHIL